MKKDSYTFFWTLWNSYPFDNTLNVHCSRDGDCSAGGEI
jgi:hypothetical protein